MNRIRKRRSRDDSASGTNIEIEQMASEMKRAVFIPVSLGKPSLRRRLEDYYSLISPDVIANEKEWRHKFDLVYDKYGGSIEKEAILAKKLAKKYGNAVRLRLTSGTAQDCQKSEITKKIDRKVREEAWYELSSIQRDSGVVDFLSSKFDPFASLSADPSEVYRANPFTEHSPFLDNIDKFRAFLPVCDSLMREQTHRSKRLSNDTAKFSTTVNTDSMKKKIPVFTAMTAQYEKSGPLSLLNCIHVNRERVKVTIRYVDCIRGTLTGFLVTFDKHMNMILRDVDEVYASRITKLFEGMELSKCELELMRRRACLSSEGNAAVLDKKGEWSTDELNIDDSRIKVGRRHLPQILVRGDNVVTIQRLSSSSRGKRS